jgi:hypothetical protein
VAEIPLEGLDIVRLHLRLRAPWSFIDHLRRFSEEFCRSAGLGEERSVQVALTVHELAQNAVVHGAGAPIELDLELHPVARTVRVALSNACTADAFAALEAHLTRLRRAEPLASYVSEMAASPAEVPGGLGLARIRYEGALEVEASYDAQRVTVVAHGDLEITLAEGEDDHAES